MFPSSRFARFAWAVLACTLLVILWGAYVRASGSGAGCGDHWPLCNGEVIPRAPGAQTSIEFVHRVTSGLAFLLVAGLWLIARRTFPARHAARRAALWSFGFMVLESLVGALIVVTELTGSNSSGARAVIIAVHQINTLFLLATLALSAWWGDGHAVAIGWRGHPLLATLLLIGCIGMLVLASSGAVTALGDALFPKTEVSLQQELSASPQHFLVRLRVLHPLFAITMGVFVSCLGLWVRRNMRDPASNALAQSLLLIFVWQAMLGMLVIAWLAPLFLQLAHLLFADLTWITLILLAAHALAQPIATSTLANHNTVTQLGMRS